MKYIGEFSSINNINYKIEITTKTTGADKTLKLSGSPFVSNISAEDKHIYTPIRCGGATVGILTDSYISDFYSGEAKGVSVKLINTSASNKVEWTGYVTPSIYSQGFDEPYEEVSLDCVDGVAVLKTIPFVEKGETIASFAQIIFNCLKEAGCFSYFYITDNVQLTSSTGTESVIEKLKISQSNFFEAKKDVDQTDDDVAYYCYDVLYEICQFLGYTLLVEGDEVYIIDLDAIKAGNNKYFRYSLAWETLPTPTSMNSINYSDHIEEGSYAQNGTNIEMTEVYNKVTVKDEFNTFDNIFPTFGDESTETNITAPQANLSSSFGSWGNKGFIFGDHIKASKEDGINQDMAIIIDRDWRGAYWLNFFKFYESPVFNMIKYNRNSSRNQVTLGSTIKYTDLLTYNGAFYYKWYKTSFYGSFSDYINLAVWVNRQKSSYNYNASTKDKIAIWSEIFDKFKELNKISMTNVIAFINAGDYRFGPGDEVHYNDQTENDITKNYPFVTLKDYSSSIFGGANHFLRIKGKVASHDEWVTPHRCSEGEGNGDLTREGDRKYIKQGYIWGKLKWGDQYWNGSEWVPNDTWFKMWFWDDSNITYKDSVEVKNYFDKEFEFKSVEYTMPNAGDGIIIPCPTKGNLSGKAELSFTTRDMWGKSRHNNWHPKGKKGDNHYCRYLSNCVFISDLEITAEIYEGLLGDAELDSDTCYTNVIENGAVDKMDEITFKVCTDDGKKPSYSSVAYVDAAGNTQYLTTCYNKALYNKEKSSYGTDGEAGKLRQEEHFIFKLATQYENPKLVLNCNLKNDGHKLYGTYTNKTLSGKTFMAVEREVDFKMNKCSLKLVEKF